MIQSTRSDSAIANSDCVQSTERKQAHFSGADLSAAKKPSILFTTNHPARYMDDLFKAAEQRYKTTVIYIQGKSDEKKWRKKTNYYPGMHAQDIDFIEAWRLTTKADMLVIGGWADRLNLFLIAISIIRRKKFAIFSDAPDSKNKSAVIRILQMALLRLVSFCFVSGEEAGRIFRETYKVGSDRVKNFPYFPMTLDCNRAAAVNERRRSSIGNHREKIKLLIANRFIPRKSYDTVYMALAELKKQSKLDAFQITIAGDGDLFAEYKNKISALSPEISFVGWIEVDDYRRLLLETDIFLHASRFEPYSIPVVDAVLHGKLVIASRGVCSAIDMETYGYRVWLFEPDAAEALARLLARANSGRDEIYPKSSAGLDRRRLPPEVNIAAIDQVLSS